MGKNEVASRSASRPEATRSPRFKQANACGFGHRFNIYSWSMKTFRNDFYVGTLNRVGGAQIWRYDGQTWKAAVRRGLSKVENEGVRNLIEFKGTLFAGIYNQSLGCEVWRTSDGRNWEVVAENGFGDPNNISVRGLVTFKGFLYAGVQTNRRHLFSLRRLKGVGQMWRTANGKNWEPVIVDRLGDPGNESVHKLETFGDHLYLTTRNQASGAQIWRSRDGMTFEIVVGPGAATPGGFGIQGNHVIYDLAVFQNQMYVGTGNLQSGFTVHRTTDGIHYTKVGRNGFGEGTNTFAWRLLVYKNTLWLGVMNQYKGAGVWRTFDGTSWEELVGPGGRFLGAGFGNRLNWGVRTLGEYKGKLYLGTAQCFFPRCRPFIRGTEVWEWSGENDV